MTNGSLSPHFQPIGVFGSKISICRQHTDGQFLVRSDTQCPLIRAFTLLAFRVIIEIYIY